MRWACFLRAQGLEAVLSPGPCPLKLSTDFFADFEESSLTRKVNVPGKYFFSASLPRGIHSSFLHSEDPAANYSSVY